MEMQGRPDAGSDSGGQNVANGDGVERHSAERSDRCGETMGTKEGESPKND